MSKHSGTLNAILSMCRILLIMSYHTLRGRLKVKHIASQDFKHRNRNSHVFCLCFRLLHQYLIHSTKINCLDKLDRDSLNRYHIRLQTDHNLYPQIYHHSSISRRLYTARYQIHHRRTLINHKYNLGGMVLRFSKSRQISRVRLPLRQRREFLLKEGGRQ